MRGPALADPDMAIAATAARAAFFRLEGKAFLVIVSTNVQIGNVDQSPCLNLRIKNPVRQAMNTDKQGTVPPSGADMPGTDTLNRSHILRQAPLSGK